MVIGMFVVCDESTLVFCCKLNYHMFGCVVSTDGGSFMLFHLSILDGSVTLNQLIKVVLC